MYDYIYLISKSSGGKWKTASKTSSWKLEPNGFVWDLFPTKFPGNLSPPPSSTPSKLVCPSKIIKLKYNKPSSLYFSPTSTAPASTKLSLSLRKSTRKG